MKPTFTLLFLVFIASVNSQTVYLEENFDNCELPDNWELEEEFLSKGWIIGNSDFLSSDQLYFPDNEGNCFAANNDSKWDDANGDANNADNDMIILPYLDLSEVEHLVVSLDYVSAYSNPIGLYYRTEANPDWMFVNNTVFQGGMLEWQQKHIYAFGHVNAPIKNLDEPVQFMFRYSDYGFPRFLGAAIDNIKIYEPANQDLVLDGVQIPEVVPVGLVPIKPLMLNYGLNTIQSAIIKWQIDDGPIESHTVNSFFLTNGNSIPYALPFGTGTMPGQQIYVEFEEAGEHTLKVWYEQSNGLEDDNPENNYWERNLIVVDKLPEKHFIYEKFSHHTCGPCYDADLLASQIAEEYDNIHLVSVHSSSNDPMDYPEVREIDIAYSQRTHPGTILDRRFLSHWQHGTMSSLYERLPVVSTPWWSPVDVYFTSKELHEEINSIDLEIEAEFIASVEGEYRFNIWTIEDGIVAYQAGSPEGNNYVHDHVLRNYSGGNYGAEGSIDVDIEAGKVYKYGASIDFDPSWDNENLSFIAVVQRYEKDSENREIVNASVIHINDNIISDVKDLRDIDISLYPNPSNDFIHLVLPKSNTKVAYTIYNKLGQLMQKKDSFLLSQNYVQLDVRNYPEGSYVLLMEIDGKELVKNFVVNR